MFSICNNFIASPFIIQPIKNPKPTFLSTTPKSLTSICRVEHRPSGTKPHKETNMNVPNKPNRRNPRKSSYGASRRSVLKKALGQEQRLELSSIWALLAAFEDPLPIPVNGVASPFEGAFVKGVDSVSWMASNTNKLACSRGSGPHCWTIFSTAAFGKRNKVPQENIPNATAEKVKAAMLEGVERDLGLSKSSLQRPFYTWVQLWGAALPTNTPGIPCIFDPHGRAGVCGDWLLGSSLEAAALSGMALANHIADYFQSGGAPPDEFAVGLHNEFRPLKGHDIGQFPGLESKEKINEAPVIQLRS